MHTGGVKFERGTKILHHVPYVSAHVGKHTHIGSCARVLCDRQIEDEDWEKCKEAYQQLIEVDGVRDAIARHRKRWG